MQNSFLVLLPPLLVLLLAILTKEVTISLIAGIISASFLAADFSVYNTVLILSKTIFSTLHDMQNIYTFGFLIMLGTLTILMNNMGGITAYTKSIEKYITNKKSAQATSLLFSHFFFIDDYLSSLTVGNIMRPLTDKFHIPRAKLAYLLDAMSGSLCLLIPASSWLTVILTQLEKSGVSVLPYDNPKIMADPFGLYLSTIPYIFYPIFSIFTAWFLVLTAKSYGPMNQHEKNALTGNLFGGKKPINSASSQNDTGSLWYFIIPLASFIFFIFIGIAWTGNSFLSGGNNSLIKTIQESKIIFVLFYASSLTVLLSTVFFIAQKKLTLYKALNYLAEGALSMKTSITILICAWILATLLKDDLKTGQYLADILLGSLSIWLLPAMFFLTATLISASTGSSWGTINIMLPLAIPMLYEFAHGVDIVMPSDIPLLIPSLGALLSGSLAGTHLSPISDTTITASTGAACYHIDHVKTQFWYVLPTIFGTIVAYSIAGFFISQTYILPLCLLLGIAIIILLVEITTRSKK